MVTFLKIIQDYLVQMVLIKQSNMIEDLEDLSSFDSGSYLASGIQQESMQRPRNVPFELFLLLVKGIKVWWYFSKIARRSYPLENPPDQMYSLS